MWIQKCTLDFYQHCKSWSILRSSVTICFQFYIDMPLKFSRHTILLKLYCYFFIVLILSLFAYKHFLLIILFILFCLLHITCHCFIVSYLKGVFWFVIFFLVVHVCRWLNKMYFDLFFLIYIGFISEIACVREIY